MFQCGNLIGVIRTTGFPLQQLSLAYVLELRYDDALAQAAMDQTDDKPTKKSLPKKNPAAVALDV